MSNSIPASERETKQEVEDLRRASDFIFRRTWRKAPQRRSELHEGGPIPMKLEALDQHRETSDTGSTSEHEERVEVFTNEMPTRAGMNTLLFQLGALPKGVRLPETLRLSRETSEVSLHSFQDEEVHNLGIDAATVRYDRQGCLARIGLITSGGDCGGLNAVIKGATFTASQKGVSVVVIPNGYAGLYNLLDIDHLVKLTPDRIDAVSASLAGSEAGHSRVKIKNIVDKNKYKRIKLGLRKHKIDGLVISGGDDTGSVIVDLHNHGIPCVHAPKTMDLDLQTYSVGADSTINRITDFVRDLRTTAETHNRILVVEVFGRYAGHTSFRGGVGAEADCILIPEIPVNFDVVYEHMKKRFIERVSCSPTQSGTYLIVVSEGITDETGSHITDESAGRDAFGHVKLHGSGNYVMEALTQRMMKDEEMKLLMKKFHFFVPELFEHPEIRSVIPGHLVRCGTTSAYDVNFGMQAGGGAVRLLMGGQSGATFVDMRGDEIYFIATEKAIKQRHVNLNVIPFFEQMGFCFGRHVGEEVNECTFERLKEGDRPIRHM